MSTDTSAGSVLSSSIELRASRCRRHTDEVEMKGEGGKQREWSEESGTVKESCCVYTNSIRPYTNMAIHENYP